VDVRQSPRALGPDPLPGPRARALLERDARFVSPSYTRVYPLVVARGSGAVIEDVDGNRFLDMTAALRHPPPATATPSRGRDQRSGRQAAAHVRTDF